jgi:hypothetical protein
MRARLRSVLLAAVIARTSVSAQEVDPRLASRLDVRTRSAVTAIIDSARLAGLPTEPLIDKALEGAARRAPSARIVIAVRNFATHLDAARRALGDGSTPGEILAGAQAIRAGIPVQQIQRLRGVRAGTRIAAALTVAADIVAREVPLDTAMSVVGGLVAASATDEQLLNVRAEIETDILAGKPPAVAASIRGHALEQTLAASMPPNGAGTPGSLPSPQGAIRALDPAASLKPPGQAVGGRSPVSAPAKPPISQRKRP